MSGNDKKIPVWLLVCLSQILPLTTTPVWLLIYGPGIDESLYWAFNHFAGGRFTLASGLSFPHGPLAFLLYPLDTGNNLNIALAVHWLSSTLLTCCFFSLTELNWKNLLITTLLTLLLLWIQNLQLIIFGCVCAFTITYFKKQNHWWLFPAVILTVINLFIKPYGGIISGLFLLSVFVQTMLQKQYAGGLILVITSILTYLLIHLILFSSINNAIHFIQAQIHLSLGNSEAVQFENESRWLWPGLSLLLITGAFLAGKKQNYFRWLLLLPLFAAWKHAVARSNSGHLEGFPEFLTVIAAILWLYSGRFRWSPCLLICSAAVFMLYVAFDREGLQSRPTLAQRLEALQSYLLNREGFSKNKKNESEWYTRNDVLPAKWQLLMSGKSTDCYPWSFAPLAKYRLSWKPRPVLQNYAAYSNWLSANDSLFYADNGPEYLLWHLTDPNARNFHFESIDDRAVLNDEPQTVLEILRSYSLEASHNKWMLFERRKEKAEIRKHNLTATQVAEWNRWIRVPSHPSNSLCRVKVKFSKNLWGHIKSILYKGEIYHIYYELEDGSVVAHRFIPSSAEAGLWIDPLILRLDRFARVKRVLFQCHYLPAMNKNLQVSFEQITFSQHGKTLPVQELLMRPSGTPPVLQQRFEVHQANASQAKTLDAYNIPHSLTFGPVWPEDLSEGTVIRIHIEALVKPGNNTHVVVTCHGRKADNKLTSVFSTSLSEICRHGDWQYLSFYGDFTAGELVKFKDFVLRIRAPENEIIRVGQLRVSCTSIDQSGF